MKMMNSGDNMKKVILTGVRPTGRLHLGHYFGALKNWVELQEKYDSYFEIADVQALTDNFNNPEKVRLNVREVMIDFLSVGIDPNKATVFIQSMIPEIAELTIFYSNFVTMARLYRNPTVKNEIAQKKQLIGNDGESVTYGFVGYPVSQAADITIRGKNSINAASPLVIVDGVPGSMNTIDPNDIETFTVLKDAASAAIYGVQAANGVILITTKQGKKGEKTRVTYSGNVSWSSPVAKRELVNAYEYAVLYNEAT